MIIGIVGNGFVGQAIQILNSPKLLNKWLIYDIDPQKCQPQNLQIQDLNVCDLIFVCVPTPMNTDGSCYLGLVESVVKELQELTNPNKTQIIVRSTVVPGTSDRLNVFFMPEFLTEKNWQYDFVNADCWFFGLKESCTEKEAIQFRNNVRSLFNQAYASQLIKSKKLYFLTNKEAEMIKYTRNCFLATKISFCNEIQEICAHKGIDYQLVMNLASKDSRIGSSHTSVPGHDGKRGFGGTCLPKDISALHHEIRTLGMKSYILDAVIRRNDEVDRPEKDWKEKGRSTV